MVLAQTAGALLCVKQPLPRLKITRKWHAPVGRPRWLRLAEQIAAVQRALDQDAHTCIERVSWEPVRALPVGMRCHAGLR